MKLQTYLSVLVALVGVVSSTPTPTDDAALSDHKAHEMRKVVVKKSTEGRFQPVWVIGFDEDEEKGKHIGFRLFDDGRDGDEAVRGSHMKSHGDKKKTHDDHVETHDDHESSFWYYYYTY